MGSRTSAIARTAASSETPGGGLRRANYVINQLASRLPASERHSVAVRELASYGCQTTMHVVRLLAPQLDRETHTEDIDFSPGGIKQRWDAGYAHTPRLWSRDRPRPWSDAAVAAHKEK